MRIWPFFTRHPLFTPCLTISLQTLLTAVLRGHSSPALCSLPSEHTTPRAPPPGTHVNTPLASCRPELGCMHQAPAALPNCPCTLVCQGTCGTAPIVGYNGQAGIRIYQCWKIVTLTAFCYLLAQLFPPHPPTLPTHTPALILPCTHPQTAHLTRPPEGGRHIPALHYLIPDGHVVCKKRGN